MSAKRHELRQEHPIQITEFWAFGFLSVVLAVLKGYGGRALVVGGE
jgi:hypothetical protein